MQVLVPQWSGKIWCTRTNQKCPETKERHRQIYNCRMQFLKTHRQKHSQGQQRTKGSLWFGSEGRAHIKLSTNVTGMQARRYLVYLKLTSRASGIYLEQMVPGLTAKLWYCSVGVVHLCRVGNYAGKTNQVTLGRPRQLRSKAVVRSSCVP